MTNLNKMYDGVANSPDTFLTSPLASGGNIMYVADSSVFGTLPNLAVIGSGANAETVLITSKRSDQGLNVQRAVEGVARDWAKASIVARNFTNYDYNRLKENINLLNNGKVDKELIDKKADKTEVVTSVNGKKGDMMVDFFIGDDTRDVKNIPKDYLRDGVRFKSNTSSQFEFKRCTTVGVDRLISQDYCIVNTQVPWHDKTGGLPMQIAYGKGVMAIRNAVDENTWGEWQKVSTSSDLPTRLSQLSDDSTHRVVTDQEKEKWNDKVDKVSGKGLSTNDYDATAKAKVDGIPANPKYTDTTYDLSKYAEKSDISKCKTKGYNTSNTWQSLSTERDLEDWIGDFDKRTRELKDNKGLTGASAEFKQKSISCNNASEPPILAVKWGRIVQLTFGYIYDSNQTINSLWKYTIPKEFMPSGFYRGVILNGDIDIVPDNDDSKAEMTVYKTPNFSAGEIAGTVTYFSRWQ